MMKFSAIHTFSNHPLFQTVADRLQIKPTGGMHKTPLDEDVFIGFESDGDILLATGAEWKDIDERIEAFVDEERAYTIISSLMSFPTKSLVQNSMYRQETSKMYNVDNDSPIIGSFEKQNNQIIVQSSMAGITRFSLEGQQQIEEAPFGQKMGTSFSQLPEANR